MSYKDIILLGNDNVVLRNAAEPDISRITTRILEEIVQPLRDIQIDDSEFACVKAIVFFDPRKLLANLRYQISI